MLEKVEALILGWLRSDNENATYLANQICDLFAVPNVKITCEHPEEFLAKDSPTDYCMFCGKNIPLKQNKICILKIYS